MSTDIFKKIISQHFRDIGEQFHVDGSSFEDCVNVGSLAVQLSCKFRHGHAASLEDGLDKLPDM